jgi:methyl-accepting chemotaxis protein
VFLDARHENTVAAATAIERSLDGRMSGLAEIAAVVDVMLQGRERVSLKPFQQGRWKALYLMERSSRTVVARAGVRAQLALLADPVPATAGVRQGETEDGPAIAFHTPVGDPDKPTHLLVGVVEVATVAADLAAAGPGSVWLVDGEGSVVANLNGSRPPPAGARSGESGSVADGRNAVAWARVDDEGAAGSLGWTVVSSRSSPALPPPPDHHRRGLALAGMLGILTVVIFAWLYLTMFRPLRRLGTESERLVRGDLDVPVRAAARGEYGYLAFALEQVRRRLRGDRTALGSRLFRHTRVAWSMGLLAYLGVSLTAGLSAVGPSVPIPPEILAEQEGRTALVAQQVMRSVDAGVSDLGTVARGLGAEPGAELRAQLLERLINTRPRYAGVAIVSPAGTVVSRSGAAIDVTRVPRGSGPLATQSGPHDVTPRVQLSVPIAGGKGGWLIGEYKPEVFTRQLALAGNGRTRLVDSEQRMIGATYGFVAFEPLPRKQLVRAAESARRTRSGAVIERADDGRHLLSWSAVPGNGPAGGLGWVVVTDRSENSIALPGSTEQRLQVLLAILVATVAVLTFGWLYARVVGPLTALVRDVARLLDGDDHGAVVARNHDRIGGLARDFERLRRALRPSRTASTRELVSSGRP